VPVVNGISNEVHPCRLTADIMTFLEHRRPIRGRAVAWIGDANNVAATWVQAAQLLGFTVRDSPPSGYGLQNGLLSNGPHWIEVVDLMDAVRRTVLLTTDGWLSMVFSAES
jgi:ornithine carbamoyltransferase